MTDIFGEPVFGAGITVIAYVIGVVIQRRWHWVHGLTLACVLLIVFLASLHIPYASYRAGGSLISLFLSPATVALALPLYHQAAKIRQHLGAIAVSCAAGALFGVLSAGTVAYCADASPEVVLSVIPKSATTAISIEVVRAIGGVPAIGAMASVLSGLLGSMFGPPLLRALGIRAHITIGTAVGASSHGIGTARLLRESEFLGGVSGLAMALTGIFTALLIPIIQAWIKWTHFAP